jgi:hypothetical protein
VSRFPLCPCTHVPLDGWCVTHGLWRAVALLLALLAGCGTMPTGAYPAPPDETQAMHAAWVDAGLPPCHDFALYVYEASAPERLTMCQRPRPSCLTGASPRPMQRVPLAVVSPEYPDGWRHEFWHSLETCAGWPYDYGHAGAQWQGPQKTAGIP